MLLLVESITQIIFLFNYHELNNKYHRFYKLSFLLFLLNLIELHKKKFEKIDEKLVYAICESCFTIKLMSRTVKFDVQI